VTGTGRTGAPRAAAPIDSRLLRKSFAQLEPQSDKAMAYFYGALLLRNPGLRAMFPPAMAGQRQRLFSALARCVWGADRRQELDAYLRDLARDHRKFGVTGKHYRVFCDALLASLQACGAGWDPATAAAWRALLDHVAAVMSGAADEAAAEPAWWLGEIVRHDRRGPDVAVVTIRPEPGQPVRYQAGQYLSIQVPRWPRVWRCYSAANAPRADGTIDLHVRAVPGGRVSTLLVEQAVPGDRVVIGRARGAMTARAAGPGSILCVAGGTGLAPLKALAEELARQGPVAPQIRLVTGARDHSDLYDLPGLRRLEAASPSLTVIPVVCPPGAAGRRRLPAEAAAHLTPDTSDIFVSGPDGMVRATIRALAALAPGAAIHADLAPPCRTGWQQAIAATSEARPLPGRGRAAPAGRDDAVLAAASTRAPRAG
jgi:NAD(P)H-flavin reductase/hemoglobin-like flavoprotein